MDYEKIDNYIKYLYKKKKALNRKEFIEQTETRDFIPVVDDDVSRLLQLLIKIKRPMRTLEIGTSIGYSAASMAEAVKEYGGKIVTVEYDEKVAYYARQNFIKEGVSDYIELKIGDAREIIPKLEGEFDLIFQDVDKRLYPILFKDCLKLLKKGGLLVAEDTLFPVLDLDKKWFDLIEPIKEFNELVVGCEELESTLLPVGDGVTVAIKK